MLRWAQHDNIGVSTCHCRVAAGAEVVVGPFPTGPGGFFAPCGVRPAMADQYLPTAMLQHRVRYQRTLDYFDDFVAEWTQRGGAEMTQEAREIYKVRAEIYRKVGVRQ